MNETEYDRMYEIFNERDKDASMLKNLIIASCISSDTNTTVAKIDKNIESLNLIISVPENVDDIKRNDYLKHCKNGLDILNRDRKIMLEEKSE